MAKVSRRNSLARGRAWPVTTLDVRAGLVDLFDAVSLIWHDTEKPLDDVIWVNWSSESSRHPQSFAADENSVTVWICATRSDVANVVGDTLRSRVFPELAEWVRAAFEADESWQALDHSKTWSGLEGETTTRTHDQSPKRLKRSV